MSQDPHIIYLSVSLGRRHKRRGFSNPGSGRSPGGGHGNPLQCSCLETPVDKSLVGYIGSQRSDMTECLTLSLSSRSNLGGSSVPSA